MFAKQYPLSFARRRSLIFNVHVLRDTVVCVSQPRAARITHNNCPIERSAAGKLKNRAPLTTESHEIPIPTDEPSRQRIPFYSRVASHSLRSINVYRWRRRPVATIYGAVLCHVTIKPCFWQHLAIN